MPDEARNVSRYVDDALKCVLYAHSDQSPEFDFAARLVARHGADGLSEADARARLMFATPGLLSLWMLSHMPETPPKRDRLFLLDLAVQVALCSSKISTHEQLLLEALTHRLRLWPSDLRDLIGEHDDWENRGEEPEDESEEDDQQLFIFSIASALNRILLAHSADSEERHYAAGLLCDISEDTVSYETALFMVGSAPPDAFPPREYFESMSEEQRLVYLNLAIDVALVDARVTSSEMSLLEDLANRLLLPAGIVGRLLENRASAAASDPDPEPEPDPQPEAEPEPDPDPGPRTRTKPKSKIQQAYDILGVPPTADIATIQTAYRKLIRQNHPDLYPEEERAVVTRRAAAINAAYDLLIGAS